MVKFTLHQNNSYFVIVKSFTFFGFPRDLDSLIVATMFLVHYNIYRTEVKSTTGK